jgi:hypothetical protein
MRFLHLIRPVMCVLPEVASPDRKVSEWSVHAIHIASSVKDFVGFHYLFVAAVKSSQKWIILLTPD